MFTFWEQNSEKLLSQVINFYFVFKWAINGNRKFNLILIFVKSKFWKYGIFQICDSFLKSVGVSRFLRQTELNLIMFVCDPDKEDWHLILDKFLFCGKGPSFTGTTTFFIMSGSRFHLITFFDVNLQFVLKMNGQVENWSRKIRILLTFSKWNSYDVSFEHLQIQAFFVLYFFLQLNKRKVD